MTLPVHLISARTQIFSDRAVAKLTRSSRTKRWRERRKAEAENTEAGFPNPIKPNQRFNGYQGVDVVRHLQRLRTDAGLEPMDEGDILIALLEAQAEIDRERATARAQRFPKPTPRGRSAL